MGEINVSLGDLDKAIGSYGTLKKSWDSKRSSRAKVSLKGSGGTPELARDIAESYDGIYKKFVRVASNTEGFLSNVKEAMVQADSSSPFEG